MKRLLPILLLVFSVGVGADGFDDASAAFERGDYKVAGTLVWKFLLESDDNTPEERRSKAENLLVTIGKLLPPSKPDKNTLDKLARYPFPSLKYCQQLPGIPEDYRHYNENPGRSSFDGFVLEMECQHSSGQPYWSNRTMLQKLIPSQPMERLSEVLKPVDIEEGPLFVTVNYRLAKERDRELKATVLFRSEDQTPYLIANGMAHATPSLTRDESKLAESFPYYVLSHWSGAMHCCYTALFVEKTFPYNVVHQYFSGNTHWSFKDLDHDGLPELVTGDDAYAYWPGAFVTSPLHRLIWRITPKGLKLAPDLLEEPLPEAIFLSESKQAVRQAMHSDATSDQWVYPLVYMTQGLIYSGHESQAWKYFDDAWPSEQSGHDEFRTEFKTLVCQSYFAHSMTDKELTIYLKETCGPEVISKKHPITWSAIASK